MNPLPFTQDVHQTIVDSADGGRDFAVAVVLKDSGSTPRKAGTKALIDARGSILGTVGGGAVEAETQRRAVDAIRARRPVVFDFAMEGLEAAGEQPICGGTMRILIDPAAADHRAVYAEAAQARRRRRRGVLLTSVRLAPGAEVSMLWFPQEGLPAEMGFPGAPAVGEALAGQTPRHFVRESPPGPQGLEVLVEPLVPPPLLVIAGGGHVGQALALQGALVGFDIRVLDDREEFVGPALYPPGADTRGGDIAGELASLPAGADTFIVLVTRGHQQDQAALAACVRKPAAYIGMIGSRRKVAMVRAALLESRAADAEELDRVHAPIGLDIGAQTVPEIATSIVAELIAVLHKGSGGPQSMSRAASGGAPSAGGRGAR